MPLEKTLQEHFTAQRENEEHYAALGRQVEELKGQLAAAECRYNHLGSEIESAQVARQELIVQELSALSRRLGEKNVLYQNIKGKTPSEKEAEAKQSSNDRKIIALYADAEGLDAAQEVLKNLYEEAKAREGQRQQLNQLLTVYIVAEKQEGIINLFCPITLEQYRQSPSLMENLAESVGEYLLAQKETDDTFAFESNRNAEGNLLLELILNNGAEIELPQPEEFAEARVELKVLDLGKLAQALTESGVESGTGPEGERKAETKRGAVDRRVTLKRAVSVSPPDLVTNGSAAGLQQERYNQPLQPDSAKEYYSTGEAAEQLGCKREEVDRYVKQELLPATKEGARFRISKSDLERFEQNPFEYNPRKLDLLKAIQAGVSREELANNFSDFTGRQIASVKAHYTIHNYDFLLKKAGIKK